MYKSEKKVRTVEFHRKVLFFFGVMDIPLYNELNLQKGNHIAILSHLHCLYGINQNSVSCFDVVV
jgi:hypothetical protein